MEIKEMTNRMTIPGVLVALVLQSCTPDHSPLPTRALVDQTIADTKIKQNPSPVKVYGYWTEGYNFESQTTEGQWPAIRIYTGPGAFSGEELYVTDTHYRGTIGDFIATGNYNQNGTYCYEEFWDIDLDGEVDLYRGGWGCEGFIDDPSLVNTLQTTNTVNIESMGLTVDQEEMLQDRYEDSLKKSSDIARKEQRALRGYHSRNRR